MPTDDPTTGDPDPDPDPLVEDSPTPAEPTADPDDVADTGADLRWLLALALTALLAGAALLRRRERSMPPRG